MPMLQTLSTPLTWLQTIITALQWPFVVIAAFGLGRYITLLENRVSKAESRIEALVERHMPAIHKALAEIRGLLMGGR